MPVAASESAGYAAASGAVLDAHDWGGYDGDTERSGRGAGAWWKGSAEVPAAAAAAAAERKGKGKEEGEGGEGGVDAAAGGQKRDWHGTSSDAFEIAVAVLKVRTCVCARAPACALLPP